MPVSTIDSTGLTASGVTPASLDSNAQYTGFKNRIINGAMDVWQRGTSFTNVATTNNFYTADRWGANRSNDVSGLTVSQSTDVPSGFKYSAKFQRASGDTATNGIAIFNSNESINTLDFAGQQVTLSFYAKVGANWSASNNITASIRSGTGTDQRVYQFTGLVSQPSTITLTSSWARYSITKTVPSNATEVGAIITCGVFTGTAGADDSIYITGVQLEKGSTATSFDYRPYGTELALCQRYYQKSFMQSVAPAQNTSSDLGAVRFNALGTGYGTYIPIRLAVVMRAASTITTYNPYNTNNLVRNTALGADVSGVAVYAQGDGSFSILSFGTNNDANNGQGCLVHWAATAEL